MLIKSKQSGFEHAIPSEITPKDIYLNRRHWLGLAASAGIGASLAGLNQATWAQNANRPNQLKALSSVPSKVSGALVMDKPTPYKDATSYNNFYEFGTDKSDPARNAHSLKTTPWTLEIDGLVKKPIKWNLEDLQKLSAMEERIYRLRCVEGWSMVIPWIGFSLSEVIRQVEPLASAKYVEFHTLADPKSMPMIVHSRVLDWPYIEGLRLDEAMNPLTLLAFGMYGEILPNQNGAPLRLVVPWKYGFKSAKSLVKIRFTETEPKISWNKSAANEYGFYSNVNPNVDHPRWSQATERRIGEDGLFSRKRKTLMFNGYEAQVASLYTGMDLKKFY